MPSPIPVRPRLLSVQSIGDYIAYVWRDPLEAALVTGKALTLGCVLICGFATLMLWLGAVALEVVVFFNGSAELDHMAQRMGIAGLTTGGLAVVGGFFAAPILVVLSSLTELQQEEKESQEREERAKARQQARAERRRTAQK